MRYAIAAVLLGLLTFATGPQLPQTAALAQYEAWPCPGGPGPGEVVVGTGAGGVPMCRGNGGGGGGTYLLPSKFNGIAWHPDYADFWAVGNYRSRSAADQAALALCNRDTGGGCSTLNGAENGFVAVARAADGSLFGNQWASAGSAKKNVLRDCTPRQILPCEILGSHGSKSGTRIPKDLTRARMLFGAAAWFEGEGYDYRAFVATGHRSRAEAERVALDTCARAYGGQPCRLISSVGKGAIQFFNSTKKGETGTTDRVLVESTPKRAEQAVQLICKNEKVACVMQAAYDSRQSGLQVHSFNAVKGS